MMITVWAKVRYSGQCMLLIIGRVSVNCDTQDGATAVARISDHRVTRQARLEIISNLYLFI